MAFGQTALFLFQGIHLASNVVLGYSAGMGPGALLKREMFDIASHAVLFEKTQQTEDIVGSSLIKEKSEVGRLHIDTPLMGESLVSKKFLGKTESAEYFRMHPDVNVLKIGGQSIMDRGSKALFPIIEVLLQAKEQFKILLMTGGGTRARHVYNIGVDLGMPTGSCPSWETRCPPRTPRCWPCFWPSTAACALGTGTIWSS